MNKLYLLFHGVLVILLGFGLVEIFATGGRYFFWLELLGLLVLLILVVFSLVYYKDWGKSGLMVFYLLYLSNLVLVWFAHKQLYIILLVLAVLGFFLSLPQKRKVMEKKETKLEEPHSVVFDRPKVEAKKAEKIPKAEAPHSMILDQPKREAKVETKFSPGKFVASKNSNVYHIPKCDWAKKIVKSRQLWFNSKNEAWENGYKAHSCVE